MVVMLCSVLKGVAGAKIIMLPTNVIAVTPVPHIQKKKQKKKRSFGKHLILLKILLQKKQTVLYYNQLELYGVP